jgi:hypothetical protein
LTTRVGCTATCLVFAGLPKAKATIIPTNIKKIIDSPSKYGKYMKLLIAALTALGLIGTGAHQAGFFDIEAEPILVVILYV